MNLRDPRSGLPGQALYGVIVIVCVASLPWSSPLVLAQEAPEAQSQETTTAEEAPKIPNDQLDSLVAPIALYPDAMLAQTLAASTYPLEVMQLDQWMESCCIASGGRQESRNNFASPEAGGGIVAGLVGRPTIQLSSAW